MRIALVYTDDIHSILHPFSLCLAGQNIGLDCIISSTKFSQVDSSLLLFAFWCTLFNWRWCFGSFYTWLNQRSCLVVVAMATVTRSPNDAIFARALTGCLVAYFTQGSHGMTFTGFAGPPVSEGFGWVTVETLPTIVAKPPGRVVLAAEAHPSTLLPRE